jgi:CO dehydrogenase nickel-insertion accessory protein CooC1
MNDPDRENFPPDTGKLLRKEPFMKHHDKTLSGQRVGIFGKGGSGKSTVTVLLATALAAYGYRVVVLDADSTNVGLARALGFEHPPTPLLDYFGGMVFSGGLVTCPVDDPTPLEDAEVSLDQLPSRYYVQSPGGITLLTTGKIGDQGPGAGCDGPIAKIARDIRIHVLGEQPVTLVDFKAGFEDTARGVITGLDWAIVIVDPTIAAIEMAGNMNEMVGRMKIGELPATQHLPNQALVRIANKAFQEAKIKGVIVILNKVPDLETQTHMQSELFLRGIEPIGVIHDDPILSIAWLKGYAIKETNAELDIQKIISALEAVEGIEEILEGQITN